VNPPVGTVNVPEIVPPDIELAPVFVIAPLNVPVVRANPPAPLIETDTEAEIVKLPELIKIEPVVIGPVIDPPVATIPLAEGVPEKDPPEM
jgi:hypothetical protein